MKQVVTVRNSIAVVDALIVHNEMSATPVSSVYIPYHVRPYKQNEVTLNLNHSERYTIQDLYREMGVTSKLITALRIATWELMSAKARRDVTGDGRSANRNDPGSYFGGIILREFALDKVSGFAWEIELSDRVISHKDRDDPDNPTELAVGTTLARFYFERGYSLNNLHSQPDGEIVQWVMTDLVPTDTAGRYDQMRHKKEG